MLKHSLIAGTAHSLTLALGCIGAGLLLATALPPQSSASSPLSRSKTAASPHNPPIPPNLGAPKGRIGGGASRGACGQSQAIYAVLPRTASRAYTLTTSGHPTLWFYLPNRLHPEARLEFVLQDAADRYVYKTVLTQPNLTQPNLTQTNASAGLISVTLPEQSSPLVANASYSWTLSLECNPTNPRQMTFIRGVIQRVASAPALSTAITAVDQAAIAQRYAQQGLWYDAITILAQALQTQPTNPAIAQVWKDLLAQSGLTELQPPAVATQPTPLTQFRSTAAVPPKPRIMLKQSVHK